MATGGRCMDLVSASAEIAGAGEVERTSACMAVTRAVQVDQRSSLDLAMARATMASRAVGRPGTRTETGGGGSRRWAKTTSMSFMRSNGTEPVRQWNRTQPSE